jgi:hypothetical protein
MSAEIISLEAWRRRHCAHHEPEDSSVRVQFLVPTWPWLWLQPMLVEIDVGMVAEFGIPATAASHMNHGKSASIHQLFHTPTALAKAARDR